MKNKYRITVIIYLVFIIFKTNAQNTTFNNVAIGTDFPAHGVKIKANFPGYTGGWGRAYFITNETGDQSFFTFGSTGYSSNGVSSVTSSYIGKDLESRYMTFLPSGNIGIGTTNPTSKFEIYNTAQTGHLLLSANDNPNADATRIDIDFKVANQGHTIGRIASFYEDSGSNGSGGLRFYTRNKGNLVENIRINSEGNVGIGTTAPQANLHIKYSNGISSAYLRLESLDSGQNASTQYVSGGLLRWELGTGISSGTNFELYDRINNKPSLAVVPGGNVGIGTTTPSNTQGWNKVLDVAGTSHAKILATSDNASFKTGLYTHSSWYGGGGFVGTESNHNLHLIAGYEPKVSVLTNGNVGIGTTSPDAKLAVKGQIHAQEVKVDLQGALVPDYVFAKEYKLKSLAEVEAYVKTNSHLPEVPSAKEIEKNGLQLGEMNMVLLKKIEELTLYMIDFKKENSIMEKTINTLNIEIQELKSKQTK